MRDRVLVDGETRKNGAEKDSALKQEAEALFNDLGLNMSDAITMLLCCAVNHDGIPFEIKRPPYNAQTRAALSEYEEGYKIELLLFRTGTHFV